jgi:hypothetical protein
MHAGVGVPDNVYTLEETLRVPWSQDFTLEGGNYLLHYTGTTGDAVVIDSQMNCRLKFGLVVSETDGAAVRIRPHTPGPDDFIVVVASVFDFSALVARGTGLVLDSSMGGIVQNQILAEETNTRGTGVYITGGGSAKGIEGNLVRIPYNQQYHATGASTNLRVGDPACTHICYNRFEMSLHAPRGVYFDEQLRRYTSPPNFRPSEGAVGVQVFAQHNVFGLSFHGTRAPGRDIVFEADAQDNTVFAFNLPNGVTNRATVPTNRIIANWAVGFDVSTPAVPESGTCAVNDTSFLVEVMVLTPGRVTGWEIVDASGNAQSLAAQWFAGQTFCLAPGETVRVDYSQAPTWRWRALR